MKEIYSKPIAEIEKFQSVDILTLSGEPDPGTEAVSYTHLTLPTIYSV